MKIGSASFVLAVLASATAALQESAPAPKPAEPKAQDQKPAEPKAQDQKPPQEAPAGEAAKGTGTFINEQLEQIVAPIALYPDSLLAQILMAATYPLEIVEAARWSAKNPKVTGDKLEAALKDQTWDPSVKSLCGFPDVLKRMNDNLDWTQDLGDAFLGQQSELMDAVQNMRRKAYDSGNLKSGKELKVTEQPDKIIVIEQSDPQIVYVPTYYPTAVYGGWSYPYYYYPPMYPPAPAGGVWFGFAAGVVWGAAIWGGCSWGWGHTEVDIDINKQNNFIDRTEVDARRQEVKDRAGATDRAGTANRAGTSDRSGKRGFQHDPSHRKGAGYKDAKTGQKFGAGPGESRVSRDQARGYGDRAGGSTSRPSAGTRDTSRPSAGSRDTTRPSTGARDTTRPSSATTPSRSGSTSRPSASTGQRSSSFSGSRSPSMDRASSSRGSASRGSMGSRGGGRGGGGGRRR